LFYGDIYRVHIDINDGNHRKYNGYYRRKNDNKLAGYAYIFHRKHPRAANDYLRSIEFAEFCTSV
jgi:hypothetical protein